MINNKLWTLDKQNIQYSYDFVVFWCVGPLALPNKDKIDPWRLAMLSIGSVRPKSGSVRPDN